MPQLFLKNIRQLVTVRAQGKKAKVGGEMRDLGIIENGAVLIEEGVIRWVGLTQAFKERLEGDADTIDGSDLIALPGFVDAHTHLMFAGSREHEFALRAEGVTYQQIATQGGGILNTVAATRAATKKELKKLAMNRLDAMMKEGTMTVEIKSGYGLDPESELKMLEAIGELAAEHFMTVVPTFLGAHAVAPEFKSEPERYVDLLCEKVLPHVAGRKLARFCDVFCEHGYFSVEQSRKILTRASSLGFSLKVHAEELAASGGSQLAAEVGAVSADHLEHISDGGIEELKRSNVVAVLLPGVSFFLNHGYAPARKLIDAGVPVALASDFNPGSCMSSNMPLMMTIACTHMRMTPEEAITASTLNGAAALGLSGTSGSIEVGKEADIILCDIPNYKHLAYHFGTNHVQTTIKHGTILEFQ